MQYAITGASGRLGREATHRLLELVDPADVVLLTRTPAALADFAARGVSVRGADFTRPESLVDAFAGVQRVLLISIHADGARIANQRAAIDAAKAAGVDRIAYTSIPRPEADNPAGLVPDHAATEQHLRASGLEWTMLRNNLYAHLQLDTLTQAARSGQLITNNGDGRVAFVTREDCAAAAAAALVEDVAANRSYDITGPEALGDAELAQLASRIGGKPVEAVSIDDATFTAGLVSKGLPEPIAEMVASFGAATRGGWLSEVTDSVATLTGRAPTALADLIPARAA